MKKTTSLALFAVLLSVGAVAAPSGRQSLKILMIGNSFSICVQRQMPQVAQAMGLDLDLASLYIGGCPLEEYVQNVAIAKQIEARGLTDNITQIDFSDPDSPEFSYQDRYTVVLGQESGLEHKFGMFVTVLEKLKAGDVGVINVSDGTTAHFSPN